MQTFLVDENSRLDVFLAKKLNQSRNQVALLIEK
ncbi:RluA family pseudouridine synthase, partial [Campylobacter jejuni]|nr:RluA family pseudouridine synthase [Campylobacter jejuni]EHP4506334.1 RluA family pseudouridine synthase [Campylobacter jejuni]